MCPGENLTFIYLDGKQEREQLVAAVRAVRQQALGLAERIPENVHFEPRYEGWSLASTLAHLNLVDMAGVMLINAAVNGFHVNLPRGPVNALNDLVSRVFQRRIVAVTLKQMREREAHIVDLIYTLPLEKFTVEVYHPGYHELLIAEQAIQVYFLHHWQQHLNAVRAVEGLTE